MKQVIAAIHPSIDIKDFVEKNPHLCEYVKDGDWSDKRLVFVDLTDTMLAFLESDGHAHVIVIPSLYDDGEARITEAYYLKYLALQEKDICPVVVLGENEDIFWAVDQWEDIFFPLQPVEALISHDTRTKFAWEALKTFPPSVKETMDIRAVAEYAVELADQMVIELHRPKIQY